METAETVAYRLATAAQVRAALRRAGVTQTVLAEQLGVAQPSVSRRLKGSTPFSADDLFVVAEMLQVEVRDLLPGEPPLAR